MLLKLFQSLGAIHLKGLYDSQKENRHMFEDRMRAKRPNLSHGKKSMKVGTSKDQLSEIQGVYSEDPNLLEALRAEDHSVVEKDARTPIKLESIDENLTEVNLDSDRIINPSVNLSTLQEYVPATKIKGSPKRYNPFGRNIHIFLHIYLTGVDDWVLESDHYKFYDKAADFKIEVEEESVLPFPKHLHAYTFERGNTSRFPNPKKGSTGVLGSHCFL